jgi:hypothetical protein
MLGTGPPPSTCSSRMAGGTLRKSLLPSALRTRCKRSARKCSVHTRMPQVQCRLTLNFGLCRSAMSGLFDVLRFWMPNVDLRPSCWPWHWLCLRLEGFLWPLFLWPGGLRKHGTETRWALPVREKQMTPAAAIEFLPSALRLGEAVGDGEDDRWVMT